jgi:uroporphyrinogen decarboxylase
MENKINSVGRLEKTINHIKPDRPPLDVWLTEKILTKLKKHLGVMDTEDVLQFLGTDFRPVIIGPPGGISSEYKWLEFIVTSETFSIQDYFSKCIGENIYEDEWGVRIKTTNNNASWYYESHPLADLTLNNLIVPDLSKPGRLDEAKEKIKKYKDYCIVAGVSSSFRRGWLLTGFAKFLEALLLDRPFIEKLLDIVDEYEKEEIRMLTGIGVNVIEIMGDLGTELALFLSPKLWREIFKPRLKEVIGSAKDKDVYFFMHTDGNVQEIIPDLIECGLDILNPIQPECMDPVEIKSKFGNRITMHGTMSLQKTLSFGTPDDVVSEAKSRIEKCGYNGGLILAPSNTLTDDIPVENILAFYNFVKNYSY